jgi:uncharacterized membrane protein
MPFCGTCGAPVEGRFCAKCGSSVGAGAPPPGAAPVNAPPMAVGGAMADNVASALCYVLGLITGIIFLIIAPYNQNRTVRFHAFQSIFLNVAVIALEILIGIVFRILLGIMGVFGLIGGIIFPIFGLGCFILWIYMIIMAYQGNTVVLPVIGPLAQKQA